ncbi:hypothetical protein [Glutamicibacter sp. NPDC087583]|uniref:hypothetical protein n=1 Tax=Glutamicibacter sp. NPDC087583 TaxID=3363995 RepID=UPI0038205C24
MLLEMIVGLGEPLKIMQANASDASENNSAAFDVADWITAIAAAIAIFLSLWTHFDTRPRIKIAQSVPIVLFPSDHEKWPGTGRFMLNVTVVNNGSQPTQISRIYLGGNHQGLQLSSGIEGPAIPYSLQGRGGQATWSFDYERIKGLIQNNYHNGQVSLQGIVEIGRRKRKARPLMKVAEYYPHKDQLLPPATRIQRFFEKLVVARKLLVHWVKQCVKRPSMSSSTWWYKEDDFDLPNGRSRHSLKPLGPWPVPGHKLIVVARVPSAEGWPTYTRIWDIDPVRVPFTWPKQTRRVWLPLIQNNHGLPPGTEFEWRCERGKWYGNSAFGAMTVEKVSDALQQVEGEQDLS